MIDCLKELKNSGKIITLLNPIDVTILKNVRRPGRLVNLKQKRTTDLQENIDRLVKVKKELKKSIQSITDFFS